MNKKILITGTLFGLIAIVLGAFAAHGLKTVLSMEDMATFETGVKYQMYHGLFLLILGGLPIIPHKLKNSCFYLTTFGVILFSGSIYLLATNTLNSFDFTVIALATPIGGILMIASWILLLVHFIKTPA